MKPGRNTKNKLNDTGYVMTGKRTGSRTFYLERRPRSKAYPYASVRQNTRRLARSIEHIASLAAE